MKSTAAVLVTFLLAIGCGGREPAANTGTTTTTVAAATTANSAPAVAVRQPIRIHCTLIGES